MTLLIWARCFLKGRTNLSSSIKASKKLDAVRPEFYESVAELPRSARSNVYRAVNFTYQLHKMRG